MMGEWATGHVIGSLQARRELDMANGILDPTDHTLHGGGYGSAWLNPSASACREPQVRQQHLRN
jgi:hypothetical protein